MVTNDQIIKFCHDNLVIDYLDVKVVERDEKIILELTVDDRHVNLYKICHGGVLTTMADTAMGAACLALGKKVVTISLTIEFMHAVLFGSTIFTRASVLHDGHQTMTCECEMLNADGKLFAKVHAIFFVIETLEEE